MGRNRRAFFFVMCHHAVETPSPLRVGLGLKGAGAGFRVGGHR